MSISGRCACGAVSYKGDAEPRFSFHCQCRACQYLSGSGHASGFVYPREDLTLTGALLQWTRESGSGKGVTTHRCAICGSPVFNAPGAMPDVIMINPGTLDDPSQFQPQKILYPEEAQPWDQIHLPAQAGDSQ